LSVSEYVTTNVTAKSVTFLHETNYGCTAALPTRLTMDMPNLSFIHSKFMCNKNVNCNAVFSVLLLLHLVRRQWCN